MKIVILYGGKSSEHEISLLSASSVVRNIDLKKHEVSLIAITKKGQWFLQDDSEISRIQNDKNAVLRISENNEAVFIAPGLGGDRGFKTASQTIPCDVVFPVLHGAFGEDGTIQGLLEIAQVPYVGCGVMASSLTMDKEKTKQVWQTQNLPVVPYMTVKKHEFLTNDTKTKIIEETEQKFTYPVFVKPCNAGSSVGTAKVRDRGFLEKALEEAFSWDEKVLIEPFIDAREIECSVIGNQTPIVSVLGEIIPTHEFYDYEAKYNDPNGANFFIPARISSEETEKIKVLAQKAYEAVDASGFSRVDFFIDKQSNEIYLNEINTIPGFTSISMFPKMCEAAGIPYKTIIERLLDLAVERFKARQALNTGLHM